MTSSPVVRLGGCPAIPALAPGHSPEVPRETWTEVVGGLLVAVLAPAGSGPGLAARGSRRLHGPR